MFSTKPTRVLLAAAIVIAVSMITFCAKYLRERSFEGSTEFDDRTTVAPSQIPGAGNGLFAARDLKQGEVIAEMGGQLVFQEQLPLEKRGYLFAIPSCGKGDIWPYNALDGTLLGGHASKINFAPSVINGVETHFQNAKGKPMCKRPYVFFEATRDIPKGTEIFASYGPEYNYDFMEFPSVRDYFCKTANLDCSAVFKWDP